MSLSVVEYNSFFVLTIILLVVKFIAIMYIGSKIYERKRETGEFSYGFIFSVFVLMMGLFISRLLYFVFDFFLTNLNPDLFYISPNVWFWKTAVLISTIGYAFLLFIIDKNILDFRFKGLLTYILLAVALLIFFYPVFTSTDFELVSAFSFLINIIAIAIPVLFFYLGYKEESFKKPSILIGVGVIIYALGANILVETLVAALDSILPGMRIFIYFLSLILKISGLLLFNYGVIRFVDIFSK